MKKLYLASFYFFTYLSHFEVLSTHPRLGRIVPEEQIEGVRELIFSPYRIVYEIYEKEKVICIIRVWHSARRKPQVN